MLAFSKAPHIKLGWLWKLARHRNTFGMRNWKKRYITLNTKSRVLSYYKSNVDFEKKKKFAGNVILPKDASVRRTNADRDFSVEIWDGNGVKLLVIPTSNSRVQEREKHFTASYVNIVSQTKSRNASFIGFVFSQNNLMLTSKRDPNAQTIPICCF